MAFLAGYIDLPAGITQQLVCRGVRAGDLHLEAFLLM